MPKKPHLVDLDPPDVPISTEVEAKQVEERQAIGAQIVYEAIRREGEEELGRTVSALAWSAFAAGLSMGLSFISEALLMAHVPEAPWKPLLTKFGYAMGFLVVILGRQQLFTENTVTVVLPLLLRKNMATLLRMLRLWGVVLLSNLVGTFLFALVVGKVTVLDPQAQKYLHEIGAAHLGYSFGIAFVRSIFAGWLIALMVWLLPAAETARISVIVIITYLIGLGGFNHIIAGSTTVFYLVVTHAISWGAYFGQFFFPALLGNVFGGMALVAALGHAQVVGGKE